MSGNAQKTPIALAINDAAARQARDRLVLTGKALPASVVSVNGAIVTVKFELTNIVQTLPNVTCAIAGSEYIRLPIQAGCKGVVFPADARIGNMNGLGGSNADLSQGANLSSLTFFPIGNMNWTAPDDPNKLEIYGPDGVIVRTFNKEWSFEVNTTSAIIKNRDGSLIFESMAGGWALKGNLAVDGAITATGNVTSGTGSGDLVTLQAHIHTGNNVPPKPGQ